MERVGPLLAQAGCPWPVPRYVESTGSTNADALDWAADGASDGSCLIAGEQTAGRGRHGRTWVSDPGAGLWSSTILRGQRHLPRLPLLAALAVVDTAAEVGGFTSFIKWPNDVLGSTGGKLAGILAESGPDAVVVGIGLNLDYSADNLPDPRATSWLIETGVLADRTEVLAGLLRHLYSRVTSDWKVCLTDYRRLCSTIGSTVSVTLPGGDEFSGVAVDVDDDGHLLVNDGQTVRTVVAGDVVHATIAP